MHFFLLVLAGTGRGGWDLAGKAGGLKRHAQLTTYLVYKRIYFYVTIFLVSINTSNFVIIRRMNGYAERLLWGMREAGVNQSELARKISALVERTVTPQTIQYLAKPKAQGSKYTAAIAKVLGLNSDWLAIGKGERRPSREAERAANQLTVHHGWDTIAALEEEDKTKIDYYIGLIVAGRALVRAAEKQAKREKSAKKRT